MQKTILVTQDELESIVKNCMLSCLSHLPAVEKASDQDVIMTINEAALLLKLSVSTVYTLVSKKELPFMKKRKRLYFSRQELIDYLMTGKKVRKKEFEVGADEVHLKKAN